MTVDLEPQPLQ